MNIHKFWEAVLSQDEQKIREYFHKDAYIIANCEYPGEWDGTIERVEKMIRLFHWTNIGLMTALPRNGDLLNTLELQ